MANTVGGEKLADSSTTHDRSLSAGDTGQLLWSMHHELKFKA